LSRAEFVAYQMCLIWVGYATNSQKGSTKFVQQPGSGSSLWVEQQKQWLFIFAHALVEMHPKFVLCSARN